MKLLKASIGTNQSEVIGSAELESQFRTFFRTITANEVN